MPASPPKTVLLVDDEPDLRKTIARLLEARGHRVLEAGDGQEALATLQSGGPVDLLILDLLMPNLNGYEVLAHLRRCGSRDIPVIVLTARSAPQDIVKGYDKGALFYMTKPFEPQTLLNAVEYLIGAPSWENLEKLEAQLLTAEGVIFCLRCAG